MGWELLLWESEWVFVDCEYYTCKLSGISFRWFIFRYFASHATVTSLCRKVPLWPSIGTTQHHVWRMHEHMQSQNRFNLARGSTSHGSSESEGGIVSSPLLIRGICYTIRSSLLIDSYIEKGTSRPQHLASISLLYPQAEFPSCLHIVIPYLSCAYTSGVSRVLMIINLNTCLSDN